jgi:hypothetical protein
LWIEATLTLLSCLADPEGPFSLSPKNRTGWGGCFILPGPFTSSGKADGRKTKYLLGVFQKSLMKIAERACGGPANPQFAEAPVPSYSSKDNPEKDEKLKRHSLSLKYAFGKA